MNKVILAGEPRIDLHGTPIPKKEVTAHRTFTKFAILAGLVFGPLAFGAVEPWAILVLEVLAATLVVVWTCGELVAGEFRISVSPVFLPAGLFLLLVAAQFTFGFTVERQQTLEQFLLYIAFGAIAFLAVQCFKTEADYQHLLIALAAFGFLLGVFGCVQDFTADGKLYWLRSPRNGGAIYGPYVNKNHFAGIIELLIPFALVGAWNKRLEKDKRLLLAFMALVMGVTIFLSGSRGGMIAFGAELLFLGAVIMGRERSTVPLAITALVLVLVSGLAVAVNGDKVLGRVSTLKDRAEATSRLEVAHDIVRMVKDRPAVGWGAGAFVAAYPAYRSKPSAFYLNAAHNDYLQVAAETGITGMLLFLCSLSCVYWVGLRNLMRNQARWSVLTVLACLTAVTGILIHSFFDFNLQVPANALMFYVCATIAASSVPTRERKEIDVPFADEDALVTRDVTD